MLLYGARTAHTNVYTGLGEGRKKTLLAEPASSDYTLGGNDVDMTGIVGNFRIPNGTTEQCLLRKLANGKLGKTLTYFISLYALSYYIYTVLSLRRRV